MVQLYLNKISRAGQLTSSRGKIHFEFSERNTYPKEALEKFLKAMVRQYAGATADQIEENEAFFRVAGVKVETTFVSLDRMKFFNAVKGEP